MTIKEIVYIKFASGDGKKYKARLEVAVRNFSKLVTEFPNKLVGPVINPKPGRSVHNKNNFVKFNILKSILKLDRIDNLTNLPEPNPKLDLILIQFILNLNLLLRDLYIILRQQSLHGES